MNHQFKEETTIKIHFYLSDKTYGETKVVFKGNLLPQLLILQKKNGW